MPDPSPIQAHDTTEVVELTPVGRGAVAVLSLAGSDALRMVEQCFAPASGRPIGDVPLQRIAFGRFGGTEGEEVIVCRRSRDEIEIHCHGGTAAVQALIGRLVQRGCRQVSWQDWLRRTHADPTKAAAHIALADALTARTAAILLDQYHGALANAIRQIAVAIESANWRPAAEAIDAVLAYREVGMHLAAPWRVVLAGPTNVGKSSLINALAGFQRAIVSPQPGTTRDVVTTTTAIDGWPVELADTAGIREAEDELEAAGIDLAAKTVAGADLVIVVDDARQPAFSCASDQMVSATLSSLAPGRAVRVLNKIDLLQETHTGDAARSEPLMRRQSQRHPSRIVRTSAVTGQGIEDLIAAIAEALVPRAPAPGAAVPFTAEQLAALASARAAVAAH
ncbi:MAG TPA: GTPase, partial [Lacipirellulaceae bacterium]|nr:GTPase [Lacipirellulaceae bacterium]